MSTEVLYRKWRPRTFAEVAGQEAATRTLLNAVASGRVAHAYLFAGPRGTGKTTMGRLLAKAVNCLKPKKGEPCNRCESCKAFLENRALDLVELDAASNRGIDEIRSLREKANFAPASATYKVYLVDEVHMLTEPAFNALLKTLEEPPPHVIFILATTEVHKVPATIVSRCQRFDFRRIPLAAIVDRLEFVCGKESIVCPRDGLELIARTATGSLRDAINMLEQLVDYQGRDLTIEQVRSGLGMLGDPRSGELAAHALRGELGDGLGLIASVRDDGVELRQFQRDVVAYLRGLLLVKAGAGGDSWTEEQLQEMRELVEPLPAERVVAALRAFGQADLRADPLSTLPLELALAECVLGPRESRPEAAELRPVAEAAPRGGRRGRERPAAVAHGDEKPVSPEVTPRPAARPDRIAAWVEETSEEASAVPAAEPARPSEEAAPEPTAAATGGDAALEEARARWHEIYAQARALNHRTGALLNSGCDIIEVSEQEIVFGFRFEMLVDKMNSGDGGNNLRSLQEAVDQVLGPGHQVRCVVAQGLRPARGRGGHLVEAAREMGARVISDEG